MDDRLLQPIRYIKGVGPKRELLFEKLNLRFLKDLFYHFPFRYEDRRNLIKISEVVCNEFAVVRAFVKEVSLIKAMYGRKSRVEAILEDDSGCIKAIWFNQPYVESYLKKTKEIIIFGTVRNYKNKLMFICPEYEFITGEDLLSAKRIVPIYRSTLGLNQKTLRKIFFSVISNYARLFSDPIPYDIRSEMNLKNIVDSFINIHFPSDDKSLVESRSRFIFEDFFISQVLVYIRKHKFRLSKKTKIMMDFNIVNKARSNLGFELTSAQEKVLTDIIEDICSDYRMHRLLQGDVGSGKTAVAVLSALMVAANSYQVAFLVPTEILAYQHLETLLKISKGLKINIEVLTSASSVEQKNKVYSDLESGGIDIIIGTHSLLDEKLIFKRLGYVIIDEEHRFGVEQRMFLYQKQLKPDVLIMTATPIPRSLALSVYGDLDISIIDQYPTNRVFPKTYYIAEKFRDKLYSRIKKIISSGRQVYIVYPLIESSADLQVHSLEEMFDVLKDVFKGFKLAMLHGKLKNPEKQKVIDNFKKNKINILVTTSVIEVGVDIPNATCMVVENCERFGLSQLHQLRGRIMRSSFDSYFFMLSGQSTEESKKRMRVLVNNQDGFKISEEDLRLRGPGDIFGTYQHGYLGSNYISPLEDLKTLQKARRHAFNLIKKDPNLETKNNLGLREYIERMRDRCVLWQET